MELLKSRPPQLIKEYTFKNHAGKDIKFSQLFEHGNELVTVHNMGRECSYCNLWAHGFIGLVPHLENRANFVFLSPDPYKIQKEVYKERGFNFKMYSVHGTSFNEDMGFYDSKNDQQSPGFSTFKKEDDGKIYRIAFDFFGPFDFYNPVWNMISLLPNGVNGWEPKIHYH